MARICSVFDSCETVIRKDAVAAAATAAVRKNRLRKSKFGLAEIVGLAAQILKDAVAGDGRQRPVTKLQTGRRFTVTFSLSRTSVYTAIRLTPIRLTQNNGYAATETSSISAIGLPACSHSITSVIPRAMDSGRTSTK